MRYTKKEVRAIYVRPLMELVFDAAGVHRRHHDPNRVQLSTLMSVKTGGCSEDCGYCAQSGRYKTEVTSAGLADPKQVIEEAKRARELGAGRFCMGAAWSGVTDKNLPALEEMVRGVKELGLQTCFTLGRLTEEQAQRLRRAGLDYYNHNLDTSREYYPQVISSHSFEERLETIGHAKKAGMNICCGGIVGMGESREDRIGLLFELVNLPEPPDSVPINRLVAIKGTPLAERNIESIDTIELVRVVATARMLMPHTELRLSAGREGMSEEMQALCFLAGANSIFSGPKLLTTPNRDVDTDRQFLDKLGMKLQRATDN
jgi:biotin synthase